MNKNIQLRIFVIGFFVLLIMGKISAQGKYPFQDNSLAAEKRIDNIISLLTANRFIHSVMD
jgi:hypothetical protein